MYVCMRGKFLRIYYMRGRDTFFVNVTTGRHIDKPHAYDFANKLHKYKPIIFLDVTFFVQLNNTNF